MHVLYCSDGLFVNDRYLLIALSKSIIFDSDFINIQLQLHYIWVFVKKLFWNSDVSLLPSVYNAGEVGKVEQVVS